MFAVRAPQSQPAIVALSMPSASIRAMTSAASADCWPLRIVSLRQEARRAIAAQIRHDHAVSLRRQQGRDVDIGVDVVGPAVQQDDGRAVGGSEFGVADAQDPGVDLLERRRKIAVPSPPWTPS